MSPGHIEGRRRFGSDHVIDINARDLLTLGVSVGDKVMVEDLDEQETIAGYVEYTAREGTLVVFCDALLVGDRFRVRRRAVKP